MKSLTKRDLVLWGVYSLYLFILTYTNLITPENVVLDWYARAINVLIIITSLYPSKIVAVYFGVPTLINKIVYNQGKWSKTILRLILSVVIGVVLYRAALYYIVYPYVYMMAINISTFFSVGRFLSNFADLTVPMLLFGAMWLYDARLQSDREKADLELQFLKNQTSPHFLINALNSIYGLVRKNNEQAASAMITLSGILRYLLYETGVPKIDLGKELKVINDYLDIQRLRFGNTLQLEFESIHDTKGLEISPGLLLPLLENAFKFGYSSEINQIVVSMRMEIRDKKELMLLISNPISVKQPTEVGGLGLKNLQRRLQLEYPKGHTYEVTIDKDIYMVQLQLSLA